MSALASLLVPALRWDATHGFDYLDDAIDDALALGVGGFLIFGGPRDRVAALATRLHAASRVPLLLAADVERGAGQQFDGCIALPPFGALASLDDADAVRRAARVTARELRAIGLNWALAPVCDLDVAPGCPIVGTRAPGGDPARAGALVAEWIDACQAEGVLACAKHFPGHGRADGDSHRGLATARASAAQLGEVDLAPFVAACDAGVASVMTAHVAYPSLDRPGLPATLSARILTELLRGELAFDGLVVSDALEMDGVLAAGAESDVAVRAIAAGCDLLLAPMDVAAVNDALELAASRGEPGAERIRSALERRGRWAEWGRPVPARESTIDDVMWARQAADRSVHVVRGSAPIIGGAVEIVEVDDDAGGPWPVPLRAHFAATLRSLEVETTVVGTPSGGTRVPVLVAAYADVVAWKGVSGFSGAARAAVDGALAEARAAHRDACVVLFSHPRHAAAFGGAANVVCAWGGERPMQEAAARALARGLAAPAGAAP